MPSGSGTARAWTTEDVANLRRWYTEGVKPAEIARRLGRSSHAVSHYVVRLALPPQRRPWTPGTDRVVDRAIDNLISHLAQQLDRSESSVQARIGLSLQRRALRSRAQKIAA